MELISDLHLHSKYSRAVSQQMVVPEIAKWAAKKGIGLVGAPDWTHPLQLRELKENLVEKGSGVYGLKAGGPETEKILFLLATEIASIYTFKGKSRRIHNLVLVPSLEIADKVGEKMRNFGVNLFSDGRPMTGLSSIDLCELIFSVSQDCLVIPAHCLLPNQAIHVDEGIKKIEDIQRGDKVYTHKARLKMVEKVFVRLYRGKVYKIIPDYFRLGIKTTEEHPFYVIKTKKNCPSINRNFGICKPLCSQVRKGCVRRFFEEYSPQWIQAKDLTEGDVLIFPRFKKTEDREFLRLSDVCKDFQVRQKEIFLPGTRTISIPNEIPIEEDFCRLVGYFLAEGYLGKDDVCFCFHASQEDYLMDIKRIMKNLFGLSRAKMYQRKKSRSYELIFYSKILNLVFRKLFFEKEEKRKANQKCFPSWMLAIKPSKQKEILRGWWRGDKGYTTSRLLMNQMKIICLRLGIIPSIGVDTKEEHHRRGRHDKYQNRLIVSNYDTYHFSNLSFFNDSFNLLEDPEFTRFKNKIRRKRGWINDDYFYLPIRRIEKIDYHGKVYNLEVKDDNSYTAEFACVHNCWTPWYSLYGSKSGFDSLSECFGQFAGRIPAVETGLSSDPAMNWRITELDKRAIVSFSDAHSPSKLGREATVLEIATEKPDYQAVKQALTNQQINYTIEFYPEEGKYHWTGHRSCGIKQSPEETNRLGETCPVCGRSLTIGVMHRVEKLAGRKIESLKSIDKFGNRWLKNEGQNRPPYVMEVPLLEILAEALKSVFSSQKVLIEYNKLISAFGSEFNVLLKTSVEEISRVSGEKVAEGIKKVRAGEIVVDPGYDGVFGKVKIWAEGEKPPPEAGQKQMTLF